MKNRVCYWRVWAEPFRDGHQHLGPCRGHPAFEVFCLWSPPAWLLPATPRICYWTVLCPRYPTVCCCKPLPLPCLDASPWASARGSSLRTVPISVGSGHDVLHQQAVPTAHDNRAAFPSGHGHPVSLQLDFTSSSSQGPGRVGSPMAGTQLSADGEKEGRRGFLPQSHREAPCVSKSRGPSRGRRVGNRPLPGERLSREEPGRDGPRSGSTSHDTGLVT